MARISEWFHRYAVAEVTGLVCALVAAIAVGRTAGPVAAAIAGTLGEGVGFYGVILLRDVRRHGATWQVARGLVVEFGLAEVGDTLAVRPLAMYGATVLAGDTLVGVLVGKVAADVVFYTVAIAGYELRKRLDARTALASAVADGRPAVATWAEGRPAVDGRLATAPASTGQVAVVPGVTGRVDERLAATPAGATRIEGQPAVAPAVAMRVDGQPTVTGRLYGQPAVAPDVAMRVDGQPTVTGRLYGRPVVAGLVEERPADASAAYSRWAAAGRVDGHATTAVRIA